MEQPVGSLKHSSVGLTDAGHLPQHGDRVVHGPLRLREFTVQRRLDPERALVEFALRQFMKALAAGPDEFGCREPLISSQDRYRERESSGDGGLAQRPHPLALTQCPVRLGLRPVASSVKPAVRGLRDISFDASFVDDGVPAMLTDSPRAPCGTHGSVLDPSLGRG